MVENDGRFSFLLRIEHIDIVIGNDKIDIIINGNCQSLKVIISSIQIMLYDDLLC